MLASPSAQSGHLSLQRPELGRDHASIDSAPRHPNGWGSARILAEFKRGAGVAQALRWSFGEENAAGRIGSL
jgi:hypothetical protein